MLHVEADAPATGRVPRDDFNDGEPLRIAKVAERLLLTWGPSCMPSDDDFTVYSGPLGGFGLHAPITCSTGHLTEFQVPAPPESVYFIVAPTNGVKEGSHGTVRLGGVAGERPASPAACFPVEIGGCP